MTSSYIRRRKRIRFSLHAPDFDKSCCIHFPQSGRKHTRSTVRLELEDVVVAVSQLAESSLDLSLLHAVLGSTDSSVLAGARVCSDGTRQYHSLHAHGRSRHSRSADKELGVGLFVVVAGQVLGDHLLGHKALLACLEQTVVESASCCKRMDARSIGTHPSRA